MPASVRLTILTTIVSTELIGLHPRTQIKGGAPTLCSEDAWPLSEPREAAHCFQISGGIPRIMGSQVGRKSQGDPTSWSQEETREEACNLQRACKADRARQLLERLECDPGKDFPILGRREKVAP